MTKEGEMDFGSDLLEKNSGESFEFQKRVKGVFTNPENPENREKNKIEKIADFLECISAMMLTIRVNKGVVSEKLYGEIENRIEETGEHPSSKLLSILLKELELLLDRIDERQEILSPSEIRHINRSRFSPSHRNFIDKEDMNDYTSLSNDLIGVYDKQGYLDQTILLEENKNKEQFPTLEANYKSYQKIKEIPYGELINEPGFFVRQGEDNKEMLKIFTIIHQTPDLYFKIKEKILAPQEPLEVSFKGLLSLFNLAIQLDEKDFNEVKDFYDQLHTQEQQISFLESFVILANETEAIKLFLEALRNPCFVDEKSGNNDLLDKIGEITELIQERNLLTKKLLSAAGKENMNPWEYNEAILKRLNLLLERSSRVKSREEAEELLKESNMFKKEIIAEGAVVRGNFDQIKKMKPEEIGDLLKNMKGQVVRGGNLINDAWSMEKADNYKAPSEFDIRKYEMLIKNFENAYKHYPQYKEVLALNITKDLQDENVKFHFMNYKKDLVGVVKIKKIDKNNYYLGTLYVEDEFRKDFKVGRYLESSVLKQISKKGNTVTAHVSPKNPSLERHIRVGWQVIGTTKEKATREDGTIIESEELLEIQMKF